VSSSTTDQDTFSSAISEDLLNQIAVHLTLKEFLRLCITNKCFLSFKPDVIEKLKSEIFKYPTLSHDLCINNFDLKNLLSANQIDWSESRKQFNKLSQMLVSSENVFLDYISNQFEDGTSFVNSVYLELKNKGKNSPFSNIVNCIAALLLFCNQSVDSNSIKRVCLYEGHNRRALGFYEPLLMIKVVLNDFQTTSVSLNIRFDKRKTKGVITLTIMGHSIIQDLFLSTASVSAKTYFKNNPNAYIEESHRFKRFKTKAA